MDMLIQSPAAFLHRINNHEHVVDRASADVELHSDEEGEALEGPAALSSAAQQQSAGLQIERSSVSEAEMSTSSGGSKPKPS